MNRPYDLSSKVSVIDYARKLLGKTLAMACEINEKTIKYNEDEDAANKGRFGLMLESLYFGLEPNSRPEPDFSIIGMELKASPIKKLKKKNNFVSKERLSLGMIDYLNLPSQEFETGDFWKKNGSLLLVFYLYEKGVLPKDLVIKIVGEWKFYAEDFEVIHKDWITIKEKVEKGLAHELSEGDTYYLGACTKSSSSKNLRDQPFNSIKAKPRAYSFKQGYVNHVIATLAGQQGLLDNDRYGKLIKNLDSIKNQTIDEIVISRFKPYFGRSVIELVDELNFSINPKAKQKWSALINRILNVSLGKKIVEFEKAGIDVKVVRLDAKAMPEEDISFPCFEYKEVASADWDDSSLKEIVEKRYLFVFLRDNGNGLFLDSVKFWAMPYEDILASQKIWSEAKNLILKGKLFKCFDKKGGRTPYFSELNKEIIFIRAHTGNVGNCSDLPVPDSITGANEYTKHSFWLSKKYVRNSIYLTM